MSIKDTICAIATPPGTGGIGVVRMSGDRAGEVLKRIWRGKKEVGSFESHKMYLGKIIYPVSNPPNPPLEKGGSNEIFPPLGKVDSNEVFPPLEKGGSNEIFPPLEKGGEGGFIDTVLAVWMRSPNSYTGEEVVEISCHGGQTILKRIVEACVDSGARMAEPGEFTKRAFLNGKMDLVQAEAVADLISATSETASKIAKDQLEGKLSSEIGALMDDITKLRVFVEASIDFLEEDIELIENEGIAVRLNGICSRLRSISDTYNDGRMLRDGVNVAIVGRPNVGKSSIFNALVGRDRAIVHHEPGTTRDLVSETVQAGGVLFHITDGAGIREGEHEVEKIGIEKARGSMERSDLILFVLDGSRPTDEADEEVYRSLDPKRTIVCVNKSDLPITNPPTPPFFKGGQGGIFSINVSALRGDGIESLKEILLQRSRDQKGIMTESVIITSARHKEALDRAIEEVNRAIVTVYNKEASEFTAHHLRQANDYIGQITGAVADESILDRIFSSFCIGK